MLVGLGGVSQQEQQSRDEIAAFWAGKGYTPLEVTFKSEFDVPPLAKKFPLLLYGAGALIALFIVYRVITKKKKTVV